MKCRITQTFLLSLVPLAIMSTGCSNLNKAESHSNSGSDSYVGTWQVVLEDIAEAPITVYLTPDQEIYVVEEEPGLDSVAYKLPLTKISDDWQVPETIEIVDLAAELESELESQLVRAQQAEATTYIGSMNRAQEAHRLVNTEFANALNELGLGLRDENEGYKFSVARADSLQAINVAEAKGDLLSYVGIVSVVGDPTASRTTEAILCSSNSPGSTIPSIPPRRSSDEPVPDCPPGFSR